MASLGAPDVMRSRRGIAAGMVNLSRLLLPRSGTAQYSAKTVPLRFNIACPSTHSFGAIITLQGAIGIMFRKSVLPAILPATLLTIAAAAPLHAMKLPPEEPGSSSGGGTSVPEPSSMILFGAGAAAVMVARRRKARRD
jgi:hypothetical protein